ncbi:MBL fold metallo-hydrolase [Myxococcota bacterium]|nr:MBL fold metallo-hydrolase [Myxococcota bacterium]
MTPGRRLLPLLVLLGVLLGLALGCGAAFAGEAEAEAAPLVLHFLDVGQGDAVLVRTPDGKAVLVDGGKPAGGVVRQLDALGVTRLDLLIATHADYDHMGAHEEVLGRFPVGAWITNGVPHTTQSYRRTVELAARLAREGRLKVYKAGSFRPGQDVGSGGVGLHLLPPPPGVDPGEQNVNSVGLVVTYGPFKAVLTGDSEGPETAAWLGMDAYDGLLRDATVLKATHHGARNGDPATPGWLPRLHPDLVAIPVGDNNYGHPTPEALAAYRAVGARVLRTDRDGRITVRAWPDGRYEVETERAPVVTGGTSRGAGPPPPPAVSPPAPLPSPAAPPGDGPPSPGGAPPSPDGACPESHPIKGNRGSKGWIYHLPGGAHYGRTRAEECFATPAAAEAGGYRRAGR